MAVGVIDEPLGAGIVFRVHNDPTLTWFFPIAVVPPPPRM